MSKSNAIVLLLACFLLSTTIGVVHAACDSGLCITTDKTTYGQGDTVYVTVTITGQITGASSATVEIVPLGDYSPLFPLVKATVFVSWSGETVALILSPFVIPGNYDVGVLVVEGGAFTLDPVVGIMVT